MFAYVPKQGGHHSNNLLVEEITESKFVMIYIAEHTVMLYLCRE